MVDFIKGSGRAETCLLKERTGSRTPVAQTWPRSARWSLIPCDGQGPLCCTAVTPRLDGAPCSSLCVCRSYGAASWLGLVHRGPFPRSRHHPLPRVGDPTCLGPALEPGGGEGAGGCSQAQAQAQAPQRGSQLSGSLLPSCAHLGTHRPCLQTTPGRWPWWGRWSLPYPSSSRGRAPASLEMPMKPALTHGGAGRGHLAEELLPPGHPHSQQQQPASIPLSASRLP